MNIHIHIHIHTHNNSLSENVSQLLYTRGVCSNEVYFVPKPSICYNTRASRVPASHTHTHTHKPNHACIIMSGDERGEKWGEVRKGMEGRYSSLMCKLQEVGRMESDTTTQWALLFPIVPPR